MKDLGAIEKRYIVQFERRSAHSPARLWRALTDESEVSAWMEGDAAVNPVPGGPWRVDGGDGDPVDGVVVRVEPEHSLAFAWGQAVVEWTIEPEGGGSRYLLVHCGMTDEDMRRERGYLVGWKASLDALEAYLS